MLLKRIKTSGAVSEQVTQYYTTPQSYNSPKYYEPRPQKIPLSPRGGQRRGGL